jgi:periplasmic protein CpxP/Spy
MLKHCLLMLALAGLVYTVTPSAIAQDNGNNDQQAAPADRGPGHRHFDPQRRTEMLTKQLDLTADQQAKVLDILKGVQSQIAAARDSSQSQDDRRAKMMDIHKAADEQIRALLDPDQQKKWDAMQERREQRMQQHEGGQAPPPPDAQPQQQPQQ